MYVYKYSICIECVCVCVCMYYDKMRSIIYILLSPLEER